MIFGVDGDFLCYYQAHAMQSKGQKLETYSMQEFVQHSLRTLNSYLNKTLGGQVSRLMFFFDEGRSWRYEYLDKHNVVYKDRDKTKRELVNFNDYRLYLRKVLTSNKFAVIAVNGYEADDCIIVMTKMVESGEIGIFSGDSDLQQMLTSSENKEVFIINPLAADGFPILRTVHQPSKVHKDDDYFDDDSTTSKFVETLANSKFIDPAEKLYIKMICGDSTDSIPSAFKYIDEGKVKTVGETRAINFHRNVNPTPTVQDVIEIFKSHQARIELAQKILSFAKLKAFNKINDFEVALHRNIKCILLDDIVYEPEKLERLKEIVAKQIEPSPGTTDLANIFRGTEHDFTINYYKY